MSDFVIFDGVALTDYWPIVNVTREPSPMSVKTQQVNMRPGAAFMGAAQSVATVSFVVLVDGQYSEYRRESLRRLRGLLQTDEPKELEISDDGGLVCDAILTSIEETQYNSRTAWQVTMSVLNPFLRDKAEHVQSKTHNTAVTSIDVSVHGTAKTYPRFVIGTAKPNNSGIFSLQMEDGQVLSMPISVNTGVTLYIDCNPDVRTAKIGSVYSMITVDSDWLEMGAGQHTFSVLNGSCKSIDVYWRDRWVI